MRSLLKNFGIVKPLSKSLRPPAGCPARTPETKLFRLDFFNRLGKQELAFFDPAFELVGNFERN